MLASAVRRYPQRNVEGIVASLLMAALCAYALMLSRARSESAQTAIARSEFFLLLMMSPMDPRADLQSAQRNRAVRSSEGHD
ncbi:hypothetical protein ORS3428_03730 [Mesorhizobium sp. ORS 3428]|nr:hypothetical protein ORS3428_03730 [Mesorhizobium sp. ORS 3428]